MAGFGAGETAMHTSRRDENDMRFLEVTVERQGDEDSAVAQMTADHLIAQNLSFFVVHTHTHPHRMDLFLRRISWYHFIVPKSTGSAFENFEAGRILIEVSGRIFSTFVDILWGGRDVAFAGRWIACFW